MEGRARLIFPAVVDFLYDGDVDVVPDDPLFRAYVVSVFRGMEQVCGTWESEQDGPARRYGVDWVGGVAPEGEPGIAGIDSLLASARGSGGEALPGDTALSPTATSSTEAPPPAAYMTEGIQDGAALAATFQCNSLEGRTLRSRMLDLFTAEAPAPSQDFDPVRCLRLLHPQWRPLFSGCGVPSWASTPEGLRSDRSTAGEERLILLEMDDRAFERARSSRAAGEVRDYLRSFGTRGVHVREVRAILDSLDAAAFQEAQTEGTIPAFQGYLDAFPGGARNGAARAAIAAFEERAWERVRTTRSDSAATDYLDRYPEGLHAADARSFLELSGQARGLAAAVAAVDDTLRGARTRRTITGVGSLTALAGAGVLGFLAYRGYGRFGDLEAQLALVSPDSLAVYGPLDAERSATGRRTALQAAASAALVGAALFLRSAWQGHSEAAEAARAGLTTARDSLSATEKRMDAVLEGPPRTTSSTGPTLSVEPMLDPRRGPGLWIRVSVPVGGGRPAGHPGREP